MTPGEDIRPRRLMGNADVVWIAIVSLASALILYVLVDHLRTEMRVYTLAHERAELVGRLRELHEETRRLEIERQVRSDAVDLPGVATQELGLRPVRREQVFRVEGDR